MQYEDIEYKLCDMERAPEEQDIEPGSFDLVIASCAVHVTDNIVNALRSIRKLLKPGGKILLSEMTAEHHDQTFTLVSKPVITLPYEILSNILLAWLMRNLFPRVSFPASTRVTTKGGPVNLSSALKVGPKHFPRPGSPLGAFLKRRT